MNSKLILGIALAVSSFAAIQAAPRPDAHAPISIMGDHTHAKGEWMLSYRYMFMDMDGMYSGSNAISPSTVFNAGYLVSPTRMTMEMHMLGMMYAPSDRITLMAMVPYTFMEMDHRIRPGSPLVGLNGGRDSFTTESSGIGDIRLGTLVDIIDSGPDLLHGGLFVSLPTASIGEKDLIPGPGGINNRQLPAAMQVGSGTIDVLPSLTYVHFEDDWSAGAQLRGNFRTQTNAHGYQLGDQVEFDTWFAWRTNEWMSLSAGIGYRWEDELSGRQADVRQNIGPGPLTVPTAIGVNYGGQRIEASIGANFIIPSGPLEGHRIAAEFRVPLWQDRNGYGLGTDYMFTAGWQYAF